MMKDMFGIDYYALSGLCCGLRPCEGLCPSLRYQAPLGLYRSGLNFYFIGKSRYRIIIGKPIDIQAFAFLFIKPYYPKIEK